MKIRFSSFAIIQLIVWCVFNNSAFSQYWQQRVEYVMEVDFDHKSHQFEGKQSLKYFNNSPDTLTAVYYHLYFNAFQPNSMMDVRSRALPDPDPRVTDRISKLSPSETGFQEVLSLTQNGQPLTWKVSETVLEVTLTEPILPGTETIFEMQFKAQVPLQIRRTGRDSYEGIDYSMAQWFPKMAEYDRYGWHTSPYVAREFYAPWGDYEVKITIDKSFVLAGTGVLQNPQEIGYGYEAPGTQVNRTGKKLTWHFKAENVHDFVWAADKEYTHTTAQVPGGPLLRFFYIPGEKTKNWEQLPALTAKAFEYLQTHFGQYGWSEFAVIQGGDGGMEYPMATLIANDRPNLGPRSLESLVGVTVHEALHSWYQGMLATNESYFAWMDEGFTSWAESYTTHYVLAQQGNPMENSYKSYARWVATGMEEPLTTHSDHFNTNRGYSTASYTKGALALEQLGYVIGLDKLNSGMLRYHREWRFRHPEASDFIRIMERESGMDLKWYFDYWINSTKTIDYAVKRVTTNDAATQVTLERVGKMPMPVDVVVTLKDGSQSLYYIPLGIMRGEKANETDLPRTILPDWFWTHPEYTFDLPVSLGEIQSIAIDPSGRMADIARENNQWSN